MELAARASESKPSLIRVKVLDAYYVVEEEGYRRAMPIIHVMARDEEGVRWHIEVEGFRPYFYIAESEIDETTLSNLKADNRVLDLETGFTGLQGQSLVKLTCVIPKHVPKLRDAFEQTWEADVPFQNRFLVDSNIVQATEVPTDADERRITPDEIVGVEDDDVASIEPRVVTFDIEVDRAPKDEPSVVTEDGTERATQPITAISMHDSFSGQYSAFVLERDDWDTQTLADARNASDSLTIDADVSTYADEKDMVGAFVTHVAEVQPDVIAGWNSNGFDVPYLVNRCLKRLDVYAIRKWSPTKDVHTMGGEGAWLNSDLKGMIAFDYLDAFKKASYTELKSNSLENVAAEILDDMEKLDVEEHVAWREDPETFVQYSLRDVEAVVAIDNEVGLL